jgi:hypothetical protein
METRRYIPQLAAAGAVAASFALATGSPASAGGCSSNVSGGGNAATEQYVEQIPTACGSQASGTGTHTTKLPKAIEQKIDRQGGSQAKILKVIATSQASGASQRQIKPKQAKKKTRHYRKILNHAQKKSSALSAPFSVVTDGSDVRLLTLLIVMIGTAVVVLGTAIRRRRGVR